VGEQVYEFQEALRSTGRTPVGILAEHGLLGPDLILGHCRFVGGNSQTAYPYDDDLDTLARSGATVAHAPLAGGRRGGALESFQRFRDRGIKLSIGTDTYPLDILAEMHAAALFCKVIDRKPEVGVAADVFRAATLGGANALGRDDLGRLCRGAKADITIVDFSALRIGPVYDPIRSLVHAATGELVDTVIIDGRVVVEGGRVLAWDMDAVTREVRRAAERIWNDFPAYHWSGQPVGTVFPRSFELWDGLPPPRGAPGQSREGRTASIAGTAVGPHCGRGREDA
jgi:5-methylthioadenosine/S-adenosylhomocysteine deaminase